MRKIALPAISRSISAARMKPEHDGEQAADAEDHHVFQADEPGLVVEQPAILLQADDGVVWKAAARGEREIDRPERSRRRRRRGSRRAKASAPAAERALDHLIAIASPPGSAALSSNLAPDFRSGATGLYPTSSKFRFEQGRLSYELSIEAGGGESIAARSVKARCPSRGKTPVRRIREGRRVGRETPDLAYLAQSLRGQPSPTSGRHAT